MILHFWSLYWPILLCYYVDKISLGFKTLDPQKIYFYFFITDTLKTLLSVLGWLIIKQFTLVFNAEINDLETMNSNRHIPMSCTLACWLWAKKFDSWVDDCVGITFCACLSRATINHVKYKLGIDDMRQYQTRRKLKPFALTRTKISEW